MADTKSTKFVRPLMMAGDGRAVIITDTMTVSSNPVASDTHSLKIPAGFEVCAATLRVSDMDTNGTPTLAGKVGYAPNPGATTMKINNVAGVSGNDAYFRAAAAFGQAAAVIDLDFDPILFNDGAQLQVTWTVTAATFAAGTVKWVIFGNMIGAS